MTLKASNYPTVRPSLDLNFAQTKRLDPRITFSRSSTGTYVDSIGIIRGAATNQARFDHDPTTGESLGLLVEEGRTNSVRYSSELNNTSVWTASNCSVIPNSAIAPDGTMTADTMQANSGSSILPQIVQNAGDAAIRTLSIYAKMGTYQYLKLNPRGNQYGVVADLSDGSVYAIGNSGVISADVIPAGNGWYRVILTTDNIFSTRIFACRFSKNADNNTTYNFTGDETIYLWGAQLETGSFPTSYIPTSGSTVTRAADVAQITGTNFSSWYNQSEGTVFADATCKGLASSSVSFVGHLSDGTTNNYIDVLRYQPTSNSSIVTGGVIQSSLTTALSLGVYRKSAHTYAPNNVSLAVDGATPLTDNSVTLPTVNQFKLGGDSTSVRNLNGHISRLTYYPVRLPDATLQTITS